MCIRDRSKSLGLKTDYAISQDRLSEIEAIRGEYNLAIEHYQESITIMESVGFPSGNVSLALSTLYTVIGEYDSGFEWGLMAQEQFQNRPYLIPRAILNQAWAQILLSNSTEGLILIDSIRDAVTKSGRETHIAWLHFVTGILEIADGDLISAASSIEEALKIYENRDGTMMVQMIFLRYLAEIEVALSGQEASICPSLCILEEKSTAEDLPGIFGQALLLKAELALKQNDDSALREIIQQLRPLTEMSSMQFLKPRFDSLLSRI